MNKLNILFVCFILCMQAVATHAEPIVLVEAININDFVTGRIKMGRRIIVLPAGNWQLVTKRDTNSSAGNAMQGPTISRLTFQEIKDGRLNRGLEVAATTSSGNMNWLDEPCKSKGDSYWIEDRKKGINNQFCLRVGYMSNMVDGATGNDFQAWARTIREKQIGYSREMPFVSVVRYTSYDYLKMSINFDPALSGIGSSADPTRQFNDWQGQSVASRPQHLKFYEALVIWAPKFATAVQRAFDNDEYLTDADFGLPALPAK